MAIAVAAGESIVPRGGAAISGMIRWGGEYGGVGISCVGVEREAKVIVSPGLELLDFFDTARRALLCWRVRP